MLFMGEKWIELHDLVSRSLDAQQTSDSVPSSFSKKVVSPDHPSWLEHALRLSRLRGYWALYPGQETAKNLGIVHTELFRAPEEYVQERIPVQLSEESSDEEIEQAMTKLKAGSESRPVGESSLQNLLDAGSLRPFGNLPLVMWNGTKTDLVGLDESVAEYAVAFKTQVGKCTAEILDTKRVEMSTRDLFCT